MRKLVLQILGSLAAVALLLFLLFRDADPVPGKVRVFGNIELTEVEVAFKVPGRVVELKVEEGDFVDQGAIIARLDDEELLSQRRQALALLDAARSRVKELRALIRFQEENRRRQMEQRAAELHRARAALEALLAGSRQQEIEQARASLDRVRSVFEKAEGDWRRAQALYETGDISREQYEQYQATFQAGHASVREAQQRLDLVLEGPRGEEVEVGRAQVAGAEAALRVTEALELEIEKNRQAVQTARAEVTRVQAQIQWVDSRLEDTVARAPLGGVVLVKIAEEGEVLTAGTPVVSLGDLERPWLRAYIGEEDLGRVRLGQRVRVSTDSFPGKAYWGRLTFIASQAEFTPRQVQTPEQRVKLVYRIKVGINNPHQELKLNMPVEGEILLREDSPI